MAIIVLAVFGLIVILMAAYGYRISAKTAEDYMLGGRTIGGVVMFFFVLFAVSSAWTFSRNAVPSRTGLLLLYLGISGRLRWALHVPRSTVVGDLTNKWISITCRSSCGTV